VLWGGGGGGVYSFLGNDITHKAELLGAMLAIELAVIRGWTALGWEVIFSCG